MREKLACRVKCKVTRSDSFHRICKTSRPDLTTDKITAAQKSAADKGEKLHTFCYSGCGRGWPYWLSLSKHCGLERECRLEAWRLENCRLEDCRLEDCRLEDCRLEDCRLEACRLEDCRLEELFAPLWGGGPGRTVGISTISTCVCARKSCTGVC